MLPEDNVTYDILKFYLADITSFIIKLSRCPLFQLVGGRFVVTVKALHP